MYKVQTCNKWAILAREELAKVLYNRIPLRTCCRTAIALFPFPGFGVGSLVLGNHPHGKAIRQLLVDIGMGKGRRQLADIWLGESGEAAPQVLVNSTRHWAIEV